MKKVFMMMCIIATTLVACSTQPAPKSWVKVEGNKFIDPQGKEIIFRGLCFSDPVKLVSEGQWNERYFAEAANWGANIVRFLSMRFLSCFALPRPLSGHVADSGEPGYRR